MSIRRDSSEVIFENFDYFLRDHRDDFNSPTGAIEMLTSEGSFRAFIDAITEGFNPYVKNSIQGICRRQREVLLQESINIGPTANVIGFAVTHFPILADIYSDPVISQVATLYPTNKSILTIPRIKLEASVRTPTGTRTWIIPTVTEGVRGNAIELNLEPAKINSIFQLAIAGGASVDKDTSLINKRFLIVKNIVVSETAAPDITIPVSIRPDARGQITFDKTFTHSSGDTIRLEVIGKINWDNGTIQFSGTFVNETTPAASVAAFSIRHISTSIVFSAKTDDINRVKVGIKMSGRDIEIDVRDDFQIDLQTEVIQDYQDIFNIDLLKTYSTGIKNQMLHNKDWDLAYHLGASEPEIIANGSSAVVDFNDYTVPAGFTPANVLDVFKSVIPKINYVNRNVHKIFRADPQYLLAGTHVATILESMQEFGTGFTNNQMGEVGFRGSVIDFRKQTVLSCDMLPPDKIYVVYRAPSDDLSRTAIADLIYKPMYVIEETTDSIRKTFIRSRTALEITNTDALGMVTLQNHMQFLQ